ncbi:ATP-grasp domain-containing protein [Ruania alkalisoli]|uniref:biotin carboxylase n=1 Tax=Ruania alkalisoli TaxID=2779775 RepID=A0A7M1SWQ8_9MICO|nr:biotin carboxylase N-terminal domain-containing protein [Ruania alkalisoli]QOR72026.1 ATP-grasp domain-containing protein [Ruania alkalisoli]
MFTSVLIANRGEIAIRIARTLRRMGIRSVAVYSDPDDGAAHVRAADLAVRIGPAPAAQSYLDVAAIIEAARRTGAQAVHPGYGFLSESPELARACADAGLVFIGPGPAALELMGSKIRAKAHVAEAGVPVIEGVSELDEDLLTAAAHLGPPLLVKPSAGGGGKGMQVVRDLTDLPEALATARRIARAAFGDEALLVERFVDAPRHIEIQVLADAHGHVLSLGERECSLQRRHQKVIEEAPSPLLTETTRQRMSDAAVAVAESVGYQGAGTVEFLVPAANPDAFAFMEMNTRLQVEHPVTEAVTGLDLVEWQVRIAAGEPFEPDLDRAVEGHAIEARIYAERPDSGFLPATGTAAVVRWPDEVRVDHALTEGTVVATEYDPMLAKVIAHADTRADALARLDRALADTVIFGVETNVDYLRRLLAHRDVRAGTADTTLLDGLTITQQHTPDEALIAAALARHAHAWTDELWRRPSGWRLGADQPVIYAFAAGTVSISGPPERALVAVGDTTDGLQRLCAISGTVSLQAVSSCALVLDGMSTGVDVLLAPAATWVRWDGRTWGLDHHDPDASTAMSAGVSDPQLRTPMPGTVVAVHAAAGDWVEAGDRIVTVEAMKMEFPLRAGRAGTITIDVVVGDQVTSGQVLAAVTGPEGSQDPRGPSATIHKI